MRDTFYDHENTKNPKVKINLKIVNESNVDKIIVTLKQGKVFGSQPYLAIKTKKALEE